MLNADKGTIHLPSGKDFRIAIVQARFNAEITNALAKATQEELTALGVLPQNIVHLQVPGALEIPVVLQALAEQEAYDALIALGCVIRGETYHFELVANESATGVTRVSLDYNIPIANAILTTENEAQAHARKHSKGRDAAQVAVEMAYIFQQQQSEEEA